MISSIAMRKLCKKWLCKRRKHWLDSMPLIPNAAARKFNSIDYTRRAPNQWQRTSLKRAHSDKMRQFTEKQKIEKGKWKLELFQHWRHEWLKWLPKCKSAHAFVKNFDNITLHTSILTRKKCSIIKK